MVYCKIGPYQIYLWKAFSVRKNHKVASFIIRIWHLLLSQKVIKRSAIADFLAQRANEEYEPMSFDFPDEDLMVVLQIEKEKLPEEDGWKMYFDGVSNALGRGVGVVLISPEGNHCPFTAKLSFECTNNVAEYEACVLGL